MLKTAIVISGHTMGLGVIRGLSRCSVPVVLLSYDKSDVANASRYVQKTIPVPHPCQAENEFVEVVCAVVERYPDAIVFPASDASLSACSQHKAEIEASGCHLACTDWETTQLFLDKIYTYQLAEEIGVAIPRTHLIRSVEEAEMERENFVYPCLIKPCQSHLFYANFQTKMFTVNNFDELLAKLKASQDLHLDVMVQEIIFGPDSNGANYNCYFDKGEALVEFTAKKIRSGPPGFGSPRVLITQDIPEIKEAGRKILKAMNFNGFQCMEFKYDEANSIYKLLEINGRHNLSSMLAIETGINFPYLHYSHLAYEIQPEALDFKKGIYWIDLARDVGYSLKYLRQERYSLKSYLTPYLKPHVFAILNRDDPKPFVKRVFSVLKNFVS